MAQELLTDADLGLGGGAITQSGRFPPTEVPPWGEGPTPKISPRVGAIPPPGGEGTPRDMFPIPGMGKSAITSPRENPITLLSDTDLGLGTPSPTPAVTKPKGSAVARGAKNIAAFADMLLSIPGAFVGVGADIGARLVGMGAGEERRATSQSGLRIGGEVGEMLGSPIAKVMRALGYADDYQDSDVSEALGTVNKWLEKGGGWIEKNTGGALLKEDVQSIANTLMTVAPVPGVGALKKGAAKVGEMLPGKGKPKPSALTPEAEAALRGFEAEGKPVRAPEEAAAQTRAAAQEKQRMDAERTAEQRANDIVQGIRRDKKGQPITDAAGNVIYREYPQAQIDAIRKRNPLVGEKLDAIMAERVAKRETFGETLQGEVIPAGQYVPDFVPGRTPPPGGFPDITPRLPGPPEAPRLQDLSSRFREEALAREQVQAAAEAAARPAPEVPAWRQAEVAAEARMREARQRVAGFDRMEAPLIARMAELEQRVRQLFREDPSSPAYRAAEQQLREADASLNKLREDSYPARQALVKAESEFNVARQTATTERGRQTSGGGQVLELDPVTGRLRPVDQGVRGATPETVRNLGRDREAAIQKLSEGRAFDLTAEERIAWQKAQSDLSVVDPAVGVMDPKVLAERMRDRQWVADTIQKLREKDAGFAEIEAAARTQAEVPQARKAREQLMDSLETLQDALMRPREGKLDIQGPKTREAQRMARMRGQTGSIDPELLKYVALVGGGAALGYTLSEENKILSAIYGAAAGAFGPGLLMKLKPGAKTALGVLSTEVAKINRNVADYAREYERRVMTRSADYLQKTDGFTKSFSRLDPTTQGKLASTLFSGDRAGTAAILRQVGDSELAQSVVETQRILGDIGKELVDRGRLTGLKQDYFPRIVKDYEGLLEHLGATKREALEKTLHEARKKALEKGRMLTAVEETKVINQFLAGRGQATKPGFLKGRVIETVSPDLLPFYASPVESLHVYLRAATAEAEKARFFGKHLKTENGLTNLSDSVGALVDNEISSGRMTEAQGTQLRYLLNDRFQGGERSMDPKLAGARNIINIGLLGNPLATLTQISDIGMSVYINGMRPTLEAAVQQLRGKSMITAKEMGLAHHVAEEFSSTGRTAKWLDFAFRKNLFAGADVGMKTNFINAAGIRIARQLETPRGQAEFAARWGEFFSPQELVQVMDDFRARRPSDGVQSVLWSEISDVQPVSRMEMPAAYNRHPNGRILYMLKSYTIKQLDIQRRMIYDEIRAGNVGKGLTNLVKYATILTAGGVGISAVKDWILGRDTDWGPTVQENLLKTFGWSKYTMDQISKKGPLAATGEMVAPPYKMFDDIARQKPQAIRYIPFIGPFLESHVFGGKERAAERQAQEQRKQEREQ